MRRLKLFLLNSSGANAVEFALLSVPLLMVLMGTIEFARMYWAQHVLEQTASAGARCVGVLLPACAQNGVYSAANTISYISGIAATDGVVLTSANIAINNNTTCSGLSGFSTVQISYTFGTVLPGLLTSLVNGPNLSAQACFPNQST